MSSELKLARPVIFGEVLFDCFPDGSRVLGGAPFNVAWHCQAFGLQPLFISRVGDDALGREIKSAMQEWGMDSTGLQLDSDHPTGIVDVSIIDGEPAYDIVENSAWDFIDALSIPESDEQSLLYHGSLVLRNQTSANSLGQLKQKYSQPGFIDVNLRPPWWTLSMIEEISQQARWLKLNVDELALIVPQENDLESRVAYLFNTFDVDLIVVTQGSAGALAISANERCSVQPQNSNPVIDTVGAGDAFSSVLLLGIYKDWPLQQILNRAQEFASAVVGQRGATTRDRQFYQEFKVNWDL